MQKGYIELQKPPVIVSAASVVGKHEYEGPLGQFFDMHDPDGSFGQKTWEQAEAEMQRQAINIALSKAKNDAKNIDALFSGDLINQCICSAQGTLSYDIPFFGIVWSMFNHCGRTYTFIAPYIIWHIRKYNCSGFIS